MGHFYPRLKGQFYRRITGDETRSSGFSQTFLVPKLLVPTLRVVTSPPDAPRPLLVQRIR